MAQHLALQLVLEWAEKVAWLGWYRLAERLVRVWWVSRLWPIVVAVVGHR